MHLLQRCSWPTVAEAVLVQIDQAYMGECTAKSFAWKSLSK